VACWTSVCHYDGRVVSLQVFGANYNEQYFPEEIPRWNFHDFLHSFMIVFRVLCGEWIELTWDCMHCCGFHCVPFFLTTMIMGNLVVRGSLYSYPELSMSWNGLRRHFPPFDGLGLVVGVSWQVAKHKAFCLLSIWSVSELCSSVLRIPVSLFDALACTCFLHLHSAASISNH